MGALGFAGERFVKQKWFAYGGTGSGDNPSDPAAIATSADLFSIPAGTVIDKVYVVITTGLTGTTNLDIGDDDSANGFVDGSASIADLSVAGMYGWDAKNAGSYLRIQTAGATDAADIYVVPNAKYYSAAGKEIKLSTTTANTAGAFTVVVEGVYLGSR